MLSLRMWIEILRDPIVRDFSMDLQPGEVELLFGPSGCGKTTVLKRRTKNAQRHRQLSCHGR